jgi:hypothetical protein
MTHAGRPRRVAISWRRAATTRREAVVIACVQRGTERHRISDILPPVVSCCLCAMAAKTLARSSHRSGPAICSSGPPTEHSWECCSGSLPPSPPPWFVSGLVVWREVRCLISQAADVFRVGRGRTAFARDRPCLARAVSGASDCPSRAGDNHAQWPPPSVTCGWSGDLLGALPDGRVWHQHPAPGVKYPVNVRSGGQQLASASACYLKRSDPTDWSKQRRVKARRLDEHSGRRD